MPENWQEGGFGLYLHWPFCAAKCPYCDFNSHVAASIDHDAWLAAYLDEIDKAAAATPGRVLQTVFFGGGTPSLMQPRVVDAILDRIAASWATANDLEITLEANPSSVDSGQFRALAAAGVNRVSLGVQALHDEDLRRLGRLHSVADARSAIDLALDLFERASFDLIYARQHQTLSAWESELTQALNWGMSHLSLYQLTIEDGTAFGDRFRRGTLHGLPNEDLGAEMFELTQTVCDAYGIPAYEVSNHAKPGEEARHNLIYWNYGDYVGIGPGAHGRLSIAGQRFASEQTSNPVAWLIGQRDVSPRKLSDMEVAEEMVLMGLRLKSGLDLERLHRRTGVGLSNTDQMIEDGWLRQQSDSLVATPKGVLILNAVIYRLFDDRQSL